MYIIREDMNQYDDGDAHFPWMMEDAAWYINCIDYLSSSYILNDFEEWTAKLVNVFSKSREYLIRGATLFSLSVVVYGWKRLLQRQSKTNRGYFATD